MTSLTKNPNPKTKKVFFLFIADLKICRVSWGFEQLSSTIGGRVMLLPRHLQTAWNRL